MDNTESPEDIEILHENEQFLYALCKEVFDALAPIDKWETFKELVGERLAEKLLDAVMEGPDPRFPKEEDHA